MRGMTSLCAVSNAHGSGLSVSSFGSEGLWPKSLYTYGPTSDINKK
jgi:hypothetical protein